MKRHNVTLSEVVDRVELLSKSIKPATFIFDFLRCFGTADAMLKRLKDGALNLAQTDGALLLNKKIFFQQLKKGTKRQALIDAVESARQDKKIAAKTPRFIVVTDFDLLIALDTKTQESIECAPRDLESNYEFFLPLAGMERAAVHAEAEADVRAAQNMAKLYDAIRADNTPKTAEDRHYLNVFMTRLLFCYFAEDTGIFDSGAFTDAVEQFTATDGSDTSEFLAALFEHLSTEPTSRYKPKKHLEAFPWVNGGLFSESKSRDFKVPKFSARSRSKLIELGHKQWKDINPDIFGSMFQGVVDEDKRGELGMHYTSVPNIMKVINPLFLDDLTEEFTKARGALPKLNKLLDRLYHMRFFDPACGSGNFLIIAYKELRRLEMAIFKEIERLSKQLPLTLSRIHVSQFYGIEIDDFAHEIAILAMWLAEHQMNLECKAQFGRAPKSLPLKAGANIVCGNATRLDWAKVCPLERGIEVFVMGNPPYLGARMQGAEQKADIEAALASAIEAKKVDYVYCWFVKASSYIQGAMANYAFVSTSSICQGEQVVLLWPWIFSLGLEVKFAHTPFFWANNAHAQAAVSCVIVGVSNFGGGRKKLYSGSLVLQPEHINGYLSAAPNVFVERRVQPLSKLPPMQYGNMAIDGGGLVFDEQEFQEIAGTEAARFLRPAFGAEEFINGQRRWCLWLTDADLAVANKSETIRKRIARTKLFRENANDEGTRKLAKRPHQFREMHHGTSLSLFVPTVSSERRTYLPLGLLSADAVTIAPNQVVYDVESWVFSVVASRIHMVWVRTVAGRLEDRLRYSNTICYNNFPFPPIADGQKAALSRAAEAVLLTRERYPGKTIAWMYDPDTMPADLLTAHRELDAAVERCYRSKPFTSDEERLEYLFALYEKMTAAEAAQRATISKRPTTRA